MKKQVVFGIAVIFLLLLTNTAQAFTCGKKFFSVGDPSFQILINCGEPISREIIGYNLAPDGRRETIIEKWVYGPQKGFYKALIIEGGILVKEESIIEK